MTDSHREHWDVVYSTKGFDSVSWFQGLPTPSLAALELLDAHANQSLIDIGGGASNLVDVLIKRGWSDLSVLDLSEAALAESKRRLGDLATRVDWIVSDITQWVPPRRYDFWHDRAVFHFLTNAEDRAAYAKRLSDGLAPSGAVVIATFAPSGPDRCSGLPVRRYDAESLAVEFGSAFEMVGNWTEDHVTPSGNRQAFTWCMFRKR